MARSVSRRTRNQPTLQRAVNDTPQPNHSGWQERQNAMAVSLILRQPPLLFAQFSPFGLLSSRPMAFQPMPLSRRPLPFDHPEWIFELKYDGFRALAVIQNGRTQLISRNGHPFNSFDSLRKAVTAPGAGTTVLDGEIICLDKRGRPQFNNLLFHRGEPCFFAFDLLMSDGKDLRTERLTDRKHELRRLR